MAEFRYTRPDSFPPIVKNLIIINVLVWIAQLAFDQEYGLSAKLMLWPVMTPYFEPYQIATHMFAHSDLSHIAFNMLGLFIFGRALESRWGPKRFLFFYLACGVGSAALHMIMQYVRYRMAIASNDPDVFMAALGQIGPMLGASGAVMGAVVGFAYLFPNTEFTGLFIPITIKAKWMAIIFVALDLFSAFSPTGDNVAHFAHLGGALTGFLIVLFWNKTNRKTFY